MSRREKHPIPGGFVAVPWQLLNSQAYKDLKHSAAKVLPFFLGKPHLSLGDPQAYLVEFTLSWREANKYAGISKSTFSDAIKDIVAKGFIDPVDKGGLRGGDIKAYNIFSLSRRWTNYGKKEFEAINWKTFKPRNNSKPSPKTGGIGSKTEPKRTNQGGGSPISDHLTPCFDCTDDRPNPKNGHYSISSQYGAANKREGVHLSIETEVGAATC